MKNKTLELFKKRYELLLNHRSGSTLPMLLLKQIILEVEQELCNHEHASCPDGIKSIRCAYCGKSLYCKPE